ncbi:MAG: hypothetical protein KJ749_15425 [Planctomycetes bacterium]|nr:hypothetical protein [Planctomycetota bacterium]
MARKRPSSKKPAAKRAGAPTGRAGRPSTLLDTRIVYCGDCLDQLRELPEACVDLIYIDPPFNSNQDYEVFWGETKEKRAFQDRHASTHAYIDYIRPRCVELQHVLRTTGAFRVRKFPPTPHCAFTMKNCIASDGPGRAFARETYDQATLRKQLPDVG